MSKCCIDKSDSNFNHINLEKLDGLICYCFKKSKKELFEAVKNGKENQFLAEIKSKMKNPGCFCETSNPSGKCCLADIQNFVEAVKKTCL